MKTYGINLSFGTVKIQKQKFWHEKNYWAIFEDYLEKRNQKISKKYLGYYWNIQKSYYETVSKQSKTLMKI